MKRIIFAILAAAIFASAAAAVDEAEDEAYQNLGILKKKLIRMQKELNNFADELAAPYSDSGTGFAAGVFDAGVKVDIAEGEKDIVVKADLPGMDKDKIEITLDQGRILKIAGSRSVAKEESMPGVVRQERMQGSFTRVLELPAECLNDGIKATYNNGVLELVIPKKEKAKAEPVKIPVR